MLLCHSKFSLMGAPKSVIFSKPAEFARQLEGASCTETPQCTQVVAYCSMTVQKA